MRWIIALTALALITACTTGGGRVVNLRPSDAATSMISGGALTMRIVSSGGGNDDPLNVLTLARPDGKTMTFEEANHAPHDVAVQSAGGALAQAMGLMSGTEQPVLYHVREAGTPFFCGTEGPVNIGVYTDPSGAVTIVGLKSAFQVEDKDGGGFDIAPYSPDHICARMHFTKG